MQRYTAASARSSGDVVLFLKKDMPYILKRSLFHQSLLAAFFSCAIPAAHVRKENLWTELSFTIFPPITP
jgi:hypothetical protein